MGSGWRCKNVICISMSRHYSRCFVACSFEIRRHNFPSKDNKHGKTSFSQGRVYNEVWGGGVLSPGTPPLVAAVASVAEVVFLHSKRSVLVSNNNVKKMSGIC